MKRKPSWIKSLSPSSEQIGLIRRDLREKNLCTVCTEAMCPNLGECWKSRTATFMLMGSICTRGCRFCHVQTGHPNQILDHEEPQKIVEQVKKMELRYVVLTSVDRDDLPDGGASHFAQVISALYKSCSGVSVEALVPDFSAVEESLHSLAKSSPFVFAHNIEVVRRLTPSVRDRRASYDQSLEVLKFIKDHYPKIHTKSSLMLGLGEEDHEILECMDDLLKVGVKILTLGQYLQPSKLNLEVVRYYTPEEFEHYKTVALKKGFAFVASGPMVRSSYRASDYLAFLEGQV